LTLIFVGSGNGLEVVPGLNYFRKQDAEFKPIGRNICPVGLIFLKVRKIGGRVPNWLGRAMGEFGTLTRFSGLR
jgi:hypothetical protein